MSIKCSNCNRELTGDKKFCPGCGARIIMESSEQPASQSTPASQPEPSPAPQPAPAPAPQPEPAPAPAPQPEPESMAPSFSEGSFVTEASDAAVTSPKVEPKSKPAKKGVNAAPVINGLLALCLVGLLGNIGYSAYTHKDILPFMNPAQEETAGEETAQDKASADKTGQGSNKQSNLPTDEEVMDFRNAEIKFGEPFNLNDFTYTFDSISTEKLPVKPMNLPRVYLTDDSPKPMTLQVITISMQNNGPDSMKTPLKLGFVTKDGRFLEEGIQESRLEDNVREGLLKPNQGLIKNGERTVKVYATEDVDEICVFNDSPIDPSSKQARKLIYGTLKLK